VTDHLSFVDASVVLRPGTPEWPGDTPFGCGWTARVADGSSVNLSSLTMSPHVGTHADAPLHVRDGWPGADELPLDAFVGRAAVVDVRGEPGPLDRAALARCGVRPGVERLLLRTGASIAAGRFPAAWPSLTEACAAALAAEGLRLLGLDAPSVDDRESKTLPVHHALFSRGAYVLENLDLREVPAGDYELIAAPVKLVGLDAAPVRAVLRPL
jgi:arylformamidase